MVGATVDDVVDKVGTETSKSTVGKVQCSIEPPNSQFTAPDGRFVETKTHFAQYGQVHLPALDPTTILPHGY